MQTKGSMTVVVDTDCGIDDALALLTLLGDDRISIAGIACVFGAAPVEGVARNVRATLRVAREPQIPVFLGASRPILGDAVISQHVHGEDGLGGWRLEHECAVEAPSLAPAQQLYSSVLPNIDGPVTVVCLGALTNLACALVATPTIIGRIDRVLCMGGSFFREGNITPESEANVFKDPVAAASVLGSGVPVDFVGLDVTKEVTFPLDAFERCHAESERNAFVRTILRTYSGSPRTQSEDGFSMADPVAAAAVLDPSLFDWERLFVEIDVSDSFSRGRTAASRVRRIGRGLQAKVATVVDAGSVRELLTSRLTKV